jgi:hypothetical protein
MAKIKITFSIDESDMWYLKDAIEGSIPEKRAGIKRFREVDKIANRKKGELRIMLAIRKGLKAVKP